jgi:hypothetical protein
MLPPPPSSASPRRLSARETLALEEMHGADGAHVYAASLETLTSAVSTTLERLRVLKRREIILKAEIAGESLVGGAGFRVAPYDPM